MKKILVLIISAVITTSCLDAERFNVKKKEIFLKDNYRTTENGEILVDDRDLEHTKEPIATSREGIQETTKSSNDNSQISSMTDGFGNKTDIRAFANHPLLQRVIIRTFVNGLKQVFVYGKNGDVKELPLNMLNKAHIASANELANSVGIFTGRNSENDPYFLTKNQLKPQENEVADFTDEPSLIKNTAEQEPIIEANKENSPIPTVVEPQVSDEKKTQKETNRQSDVNKMQLQITKVKKTDKQSSEKN